MFDHHPKTVKSNIYCSSNLSSKILKKSLKISHPKKLVLTYAKTQPNHNYLQFARHFDQQKQPQKA